MIFSNHQHKSIRGRFGGRYAWAIAFAIGLLPLIAGCGGAAGAPGTDASNASSTTTAPDQTTESTQQKDVATGQGGADSGQAGVAKASYTVPTITCPSCSARVHASAMEEPGVIGTNIRGQDVSVTYDPQKTDPGSIAAAIREYGDTVKNAEKVEKVGG